MIKVAGCWEQGWNTPILEFDLWHFPLREYAVDEFIMSPVSGINKKVTEYDSTEAVIKANPEMDIVFVDEEGEIELQDFEHPENALYIGGRAGYSPFKVIGGKSVKVKTPTGKGRLWAHQAMVLVLQDRYDRNSI